MNTLFVLRNQDSLFINRHIEWVSGREANTLFRAKHKDEALNEVFEISARDFGQRITVEEVSATEKGQPVIPAEWVVELPEPEQPQDELLPSGVEQSPQAELLSGEVAENDTAAASGESQAPGATDTEDNAANLDILQAQSA